MASLNKESIQGEKRSRRNAVWMLILLMLAISPWVAEILNGLIRGLLRDFGNFNFNFNYFECLQLLFMEKIRILLAGAFLLIVTCLFILNLSISNPTVTNARTVQVARGIVIPAPSGNGECGTDWFMTEDRKREVFEVCEYDRRNGFRNLSGDAGIIVDYGRSGEKETIKYLTKEVHTIIFGTTGIGKSRRLLLTSVWLDIRAGVNICLTDIKGDIYAYTTKFAEQNGYRQIVYDLRDPEKGMHYNYMEEIVGYLEKGDISEATDRTWDLVSTLVGEAKGEKLWTNGESATIAAVILLVAQDAPEECRNLTNVYYFLQHMCKSDEEGNMPINGYLQGLPDNHPARGAFAAAEIASTRTRSSFFTSAISTLRLFTGYSIAEMSSRSDYTFENFDEEKTIVYVILPDEKQTRYDLCTLYIDQIYVKLLESAKRKGGSLDRKFIFKWDEFGNCPTVALMGGKMSAARSRNIFFELYIQDYQQLENKYKGEYKNIKSNAALKIYLRSGDNDSLEDLSKSCGTYTIEKGGASTSAGEGRGNNISFSSSASLESRRLLYPTEIKRIQPPDALVLLDGEAAAITNLPDISEWYANAELGLGDREHNKNLQKEVHENRAARKAEPPELWGIWKKYEAFPEPEYLENEDFPEPGYLEDEKVSLFY